MLLLNLETKTHFGSGNDNADENDLNGQSMELRNSSYDENTPLLAIKK